MHLCPICNRRTINVLDDDDDDDANCWAISLRHVQLKRYQIDYMVVIRLLSTLCVDYIRLTYGCCLDSVCVFCGFNCGDVSSHVGDSSVDLCRPVVHTV